MAHICSFLFDRSPVHQEDALLRRRILDWAISLKRSLSAPTGSRICMLGMTSVVWMETSLACLCNGWILVPLNLRWSPSELLEAVNSVSPSVLFFDKDAAAVAHYLQNAMPLQIISMEAKQKIENRQGIEATQGHDDDRCFRSIGRGRDTAIIVFTSGTTGRPKGVMLSHEAVLFQSMYKIIVCRYSAEDVYLHTAPLCHVGGLISALAMTIVGAQQVFMKKFEAVEAAERIRDHHVTCFIAVPAMFNDLLKVKKPFTTVRKLLIGGGSMNRQQAVAVGVVCPNASVWTAYGMTEAASSLTYFGPLTPPQLLDNLPAGYPIPGTSITVDATTGEVLAKGPYLMEGYWKHPEATAKSFTPAGYFKTGDVGYITNSGALILKGRLKEMIKSGGENVYPLEVTTFLLRHPAVADAVVVGLPHSRLGETVCAYITLPPSYDWLMDDAVPSRFIGARSEEATLKVSPKELKEFCFSQGLSRFKAPKIFIAQITPLPRTATGKHDLTVINALMRQLSLTPSSKL